MRVLRILLIVLGVLVLIGIVMGLTGPKSYHVERSAVIKASPDAVWPYTSSARIFQEWSPFRKMDTTATVEYFGDEGQVGSGFKWKGKKSGKGEQEYTVLEPGKSSNVHLTFYTPFGVSEADSYMNLEPDTEGTKLTWGVKGENNFMGRVRGTVMNMEKMMGPIFEGGLTDLNTLVVSRNGSTGEARNAIHQMEFPGGKYLGVRGDVKMSEIEAFYGKNLPAVMEALQKAGVQIAGMPSGLYWTWDEATGMSNMMACVAFTGDIKTPAGMEIVDLAPGKAAIMKYMGGYSGLGNAHMELDSYLKTNSLIYMPPAIEEYATDPGMEPDSNKWVTKITYLVK